MITKRLFKLSRVFLFILIFGKNIQAAQDPSQESITLEITGEITRRLKRFNIPIKIKKSYDPNTKVQIIFDDIREDVKKNSKNFKEEEINNLYFLRKGPKKMEKICSTSEWTLKELVFKTSGINKIGLLQKRDLHSPYNDKNRYYASEAPKIFVQRENGDCIGEIANYPYDTSIDQIIEQTKKVYDCIYSTPFLYVLNEDEVNNFENFRLQLKNRETKEILYKDLKKGHQDNSLSLRELNLLGVKLAVLLIPPLLRK